MEENSLSAPASDTTTTVPESTGRALGELRADMTKRMDDMQMSLSQQIRDLAGSLGNALKPPEAIPEPVAVPEPAAPPLEVTKEEPPLRKLRRPSAVGKRVIRHG